LQLTGHLRLIVPFLNDPLRPWINDSMLMTVAVTVSTSSIADCHVWCVKRSIHFCSTRIHGMQVQHTPSLHTLYSISLTKQLEQRQVSLRMMRQKKLLPFIACLTKHKPNQTNPKRVNIPILSYCYCVVTSPSLFSISLTIIPNVERLCEYNTI
jgi:hypothetical protein